MNINNYINTKQLKENFDQTRKDLKDSIIGTAQVLKEQRDKKFGTKTTETYDVSNENNYDLNAKEEVVKNNQQATTVRHVDGQTLLRVLSAWQVLLDRYIPITCSFDWHDKSVKGRDAISIDLTAPQGLTLSLNFLTQTFTQQATLDTSAMVNEILVLLPQMLVNKVSELQVREQSSYDFAKETNSDSAFKMKGLHDDEDYFIRIAQALSLITKYPHLEKAIDLHNSENAQIPYFDPKIEADLIKQYKEFVSTYNLADFYPSHITYYNEVGTNKSVCLQVKIARSNGVLVKTFSIYPTSANDFKNYIAATFVNWQKQLAKANIQNLVKAVKKSTNQVYSDERLNLLVKDDIVAFGAIVDDIQKNMNQEN